MRAYKTPITIDLLKKHNSVFFSPKTVKFHEDQGYEVFVEDGKHYLRVKNKLTMVAIYSIDPRTLKLNHKS